MDDLDERQQQAVLQLQDLTNAADGEVCRSVLASVDWDVQQAADLIFGQGVSVDSAAASSSSSRTNTMQTFDIDDSQQGDSDSARQQRYPPPPSSSNNTITTLGAYAPLARPLLIALALPLHILASLVRFVLNVLRIPFPHRFASFGLGGFGLTLARPFAGIWTTGIRQGPTTGAGTGRAGGPERWVRELEEETGATARRRGGSGEGEGTSSAMEAGSSGVTARTNARSGGDEDDEESEDRDGRRRYLPEFVMCSYEEMLRRCQQEARIGCVVLVSEEHDDVKEFKRSTLTDPAFVDILHENNVLVWGGDVRDRDAWSASEKLQATTYPFVAFLALQPRRAPSSLLSSSSSSSPPTLTVLSRHQGPCIPSSAPTSATTLTHHLSTQLIPRVTPFLVRMRNIQRERERERELRLEQDRAFALTAQRDKERIERKMREEREAKELERRAVEEEKMREKERERRAEVERRRREGRMGWRRWTRRAVVGGAGAGSTAVNGNSNGNGTTPKTNGGQGLRVAIRLPSGARVVHTFDSDASLTTLYAVVDAALIPTDLNANEDPLSPPEFELGAESSKTVPKTRLEAELVLEKYILSYDTTSTSTSVSASTSTSSAPTSSSTSSSSATKPQSQGDAYWSFHILSSYPRVPIPWSTGVRLADVEQLRGGGQVVVEVSSSSSVGGEGDRRKSGESGRGASPPGVAEEKEDEDEDDGYDTEESE